MFIGFIGWWVFIGSLLVGLGVLGLVSVPALTNWQLPPVWYGMSALLVVVGAPRIAYALAART